MVSAFLSLEHLEILLLTEKIMMGGGWQWQGQLPESFAKIWVVQVVILFDLD
jgi:hypothetical protein